MTEHSSTPNAETTGSYWLISEAARSCGGELCGPDGIFPRKVVVDSREVQPGHAFVALKGQNTDGHLFLEKAFKNGARVIVAENESWEQSGITLPSGHSVILTGESTRNALLRMARQHLDNVAPREVIAITGSVGKTTTREITAALLRDHHQIHVAQKSYNTDVGCALTILAMPLDTEILILEMGCSHPGEIAEMVDWFPPTRGIITEIGPSHLEGLGTVEGVLSAKLEITRSKRLRSLSFNNDNRLLAEKLRETPYKRIHTMGVGWTEGAHLQVVSAQRESDSGTEPFFRSCLEMEKKRASVTYSLFGLHNARNIGLALSIVCAIDDKSLTDLHLDLESPKGRGRMFHLKGGGVVIDDSYNANPLSIKAALRNFQAFTGAPDSWVVLGGMKELGQSSSSEHAKIKAETDDIPKRIFVGQEWNPEHSSPEQELWFVPDADSAIEILRSELAPGSSLLVKGSRAYGLEKIVDWLVNRVES